MPFELDSVASIINQNALENKIIRLTNCSLLKDEDLVKDDLWLCGGIIVDEERLFFDQQKRAQVVLDCGGAIISPGFLDIQINGGYGIDFSDPTDANLAKGVEKVAKQLLCHGVTGFCPTVITSTPGTYAQILPLLRSTIEREWEGARVLGLHLEGPFINSEKRGMHPEKFVHPLTLPGENSIESGKSQVHSMEKMYGSLDGVKIITIAPELPNAIPTIDDLVHKRKIRVSLGHSMASMEQGEAAMQAGASLITHLFSSMLPFHHRDPHLVGLLTSHVGVSSPSQSPIYFGIIADLLHTHPAALRIAHRTNKQGLILVTDANPAMGLQDGLYTFGAKSVSVVDKKSYVEGTNTLAGATTPLDSCIRNYLHSTRATRAEVLLAATNHPAQVLGMNASRGRLIPGARADLVFLSDELDVLATWMSGRVVYQASDFKTWKIFRLF